MHKKLIFLFFSITCLFLLISCSDTGYVTYENESYGLPGEKITVEVKTDVESLVGAWSSGLLQLSLRDSVNGEEITATVTKKDMVKATQLQDKIRIVIIPVEIVIPANAVVPSTWSGSLKGEVTVPVRGEHGFYETHKSIDAPVTLHITTVEEITTISNKIRNDALSEKLAVFLRYAGVLAVVIVLALLSDFAKKRFGW